VLDVPPAGSGDAITRDGRTAAVFWLRERLVRRRRI